MFYRLVFFRTVFDRSALGYLPGLGVAGLDLSTFTARGRRPMKQMQATENHNFHFFQFQKMIVNKKMIFKIWLEQGVTNEKGGEIVTFCNSQQEVDHKLAKSCNHNNFAKEKDDFEYFVVLGWLGGQLVLQHLIACWKW